MATNCGRLRRKGLWVILQPGFWFARITAHLDWSSFRDGAQCPIHGVPIGLLSADAEQKGTQLDTIARALGLICSHDPRSLDRLRLHTRGLYIYDGLDTTAPASFDPALRLVRLRDTFLDRPTTTPEWVAAMLVHEAAHAWLEARGIDYGVDRRTRIEHVCYGYELAFLRRLPEQDVLVARVEFLMEAVRTRPHLYSNLAFTRRMVLGLASAGVPDLLLRFVVGRLLRARARQAAATQANNPASGGRD